MVEEAGVTIGGITRGIYVFGCNIWFLEILHDFGLFTNSLKSLLMFRIFFTVYFFLCILKFWWFWQQLFVYVFFLFNAYYLNRALFSDYLSLGETNMAFIWESFSTVLLHFGYRFSFWNTTFVNQISDVDVLFIFHLDSIVPILYTRLVEFFMNFIF